MLKEKINVEKNIREEILPFELKFLVRENFQLKKFLSVKKKI